MTSKQNNEALNFKPDENYIDKDVRSAHQSDSSIFSVYIIIVTYNAEKWLPVFGQNFQKLPAGWKVIVVDNASTDNTVAALGELYPDFNVVVNAENIGFGRANNVGLKMALDDGVEHVFLLNQDASIEPDELEKLLALQKNNPEYFILSPMQYDLEKKNINGVFASFCNPYACPELLGDAFKGASKDIYQAKFTNAATWLVSRECLKNIGGFNPAFFLYSEDDEYARRVNYHGGKIGIAPAVSALHNDRVISRRPMGHKFFHKLAIYFDPANSSPSLFKVMVAWLDSLFRSFSQFGHSRQLIRQLGYLYKNHLVSQTKREKLKKKSPHFLRSSAHDDM